MERGGAARSCASGGLRDLVVRRGRRRRRTDWRCDEAAAYRGWGRGGETHWGCGGASTTSSELEGEATPQAMAKEQPEEPSMEESGLSISPSYRCRAGGQRGFVLPGEDVGGGGGGHRRQGMPVRGSARLDLRWEWRGGAGAEPWPPLGFLVGSHLTFSNLHRPGLNRQTQYKLLAGA
jgi:hypothetical protein